jgi:hypothetical protein
MNKIVILRGNLDRIYPNSYENLAKSFSLSKSVENTDKILLKKYGLRCINYLDYNVMDESKFALFMLKYPDHIKEIIAYE